MVAVYHINYFFSYMIKLKSGCIFSCTKIILNNKVSFPVHDVSSPSGHAQIYPLGRGRMGTGLGTAHISINFDRNWKEDKPVLLTIDIARSRGML